MDRTQKILVHSPESQAVSIGSQNVKYRRTGFPLYLHSNSQWACKQKPRLLSFRKNMLSPQQGAGCQWRKQWAKKDPHDQPWGPFPPPQHPWTEWPPSPKPHCLSSHCVYRKGPGSQEDEFQQSMSSTLSLPKMYPGSSDTGRSVWSTGTIPPHLPTKESSSFHSPLTHSPSREPHGWNNNHIFIKQSPEKPKSERQNSQLYFFEVTVIPQREK